MKLTINGNETTVSEGLNVGQLLTEQNVEMPDMVSVELNGEIMDREAYDTTLLQENDVLEFLYFMGGGTNN